MKNIVRLTAALLLTASAAAGIVAEASKPNIVLILVDDMGFSEGKTE